MGWRARLWMSGLADGDEYAWISRPSARENSGGGGGGGGGMIPDSESCSEQDFQKIRSVSREPQAGHGVSRETKAQVEPTSELATIMRAAVDAQSGQSDGGTWMMGRDLATSSNGVGRALAFSDLLELAKETSITHHVAHACVLPVSHSYLLACILEEALRRGVGLDMEDLQWIGGEKTWSEGGGSTLKTVEARYRRVVKERSENVDQAKIKCHTSEHRQTPGCDGRLQVHALVPRMFRYYWCCACICLREARWWSIVMARFGSVQVHVGPVRRSDPVRTPDAIGALMRQEFLQRGLAACEPSKARLRDGGSNHEGWTDCRTAVLGRYRSLSRIKRINYSSAKSLPIPPP
ncbi:hypothetical protein C8F01DRAFT_1231365 [Mycena amicta]|nr:hypothetical protein C8F01DRAFT_1231365 [Mycena amicta]